MVSLHVSGTVPERFQVSRPPVIGGHVDTGTGAIIPGSVYRCDHARKP
jgi:hypothetical protein